MPWPTKVYSDKHNGDVFVMTDQRCGYDDCDHNLWQATKSANPAKEIHSKYRTSVDKEADKIRSAGVTNDDTELLCMHCGYHSPSNGRIEIGMLENDYSSAQL